MFTTTPVGTRRIRTNRRQPVIPPNVPSAPPGRHPSLLQQPAAAAAAAATLSSFTERGRPLVYDDESDETDVLESISVAQDNIMTPRPRRSQITPEREQPADAHVYGTRSVTRSTRKSRPLSEQNENVANERKRSLRSSSLVRSIDGESDKESAVSFVSSRSSNGSKSGYPRRSPRLSSRYSDSGGSTPMASRQVSPEMDPNYSFREEDAAYAQIGMNASIDNTLMQARLDRDSSQIDEQDNLIDQEMLDEQLPEMTGVDQVIAIGSLLKIQLFTLLMYAKSLLAPVFSKNALLFSLLFVLTALGANFVSQSVNSGTVVARLRSIFPPFETPLRAPETNEEVISRLLKLESKLGKISSTSQAFKNEYVQYVKAEEAKVSGIQEAVKSSLVQQFASSDGFNQLKSDLSKSAAAAQESYSALSSAFRKFQSRHEDAEESVGKLTERVQAIDGVSNGRFASLDSQVANIFAMLAETNAAMTSAKEQFKSLEGKVQSHDTQIQVVGSSLTDLESKVNDAVSRMASIVQDSAINAIDKILPERLPVRFEDDGSLYIVPEFWKYLQAAFPSKTEVEDSKSQLEKFRNYFSQSEKREENTVSWEEFLIRNEDTLNSYLDAHIQGYYGKLDDRDSFVSKGYFLDLLRREMESVKDEFVHKLRDSEGELEKLVTDSVAKAAFTSTVSGGSGSSVNLTQSAIDTLIDEALMRFQDGLARKHDFADFKSGARSNPFTTSQTFDPYGGGSGSWNALSSLLSKEIPTPSEALDPELALGHCWAFPGQEGSLGIRLSEWIYVDEVAINHIPKSLARDVRSAPKEFEFWVEVNHDKERSELCDAMDGVYSTRQINVKEGGDRIEIKAPKRPQTDVGTKAKSCMKKDKYVMVGRFTYDINGPFHLQSFRLARPAARVLKRVAINNVFFRFLQNWGAEAYTCIYKTLVYGNPVDGVYNVGQSDIDDGLEGTNPGLWDDDRGLGEDIPL
ncbi:hypothetical protein POJ06DRAFT_258202 [Lipomyces tetrasporus]|uniref:SUN domain-containing protein n=1 Tax=Lipomyces tetrasporus TaxID=54092 RepID=A0AAD7VS79_9ASCO|nr:uncharacterized protein POJ06DRAFT_258202 [Lipomyces tetrasporus]KAJ8098860.1 hypothetical protein POJ06DRAFT_258202 [Lipomyces tetrasporus]